MLRELPVDELDVVAVGAHPDDVEIGCGGTLAALARQGYRVGVIDLTDGEPTPQSPGPHVRLAEAQEAANVLGMAVRETLDLQNRRLFDSFEARVALATLFRRYSPKLVIGMEGHTTLASPDHYQAQLITEAAVFYSRLTKWDEHFAGMRPHTIRALATFNLNLTDFGAPRLPGCVVSDIGDTFETKVRAIRSYHTQFPPAKEGFFARLSAANGYWGEAAGFRFGELLRAHRAVGTSDLMRTLCPGYDRRGS
jgi:LmbE family N-acetylglucosaminyl deacetylase